MVVYLVFFFNNSSYEFFVASTELIILNYESDRLIIKVYIKSGHRAMLSYMIRKVLPTLEQLI